MASDDDRPRKIAQPFGVPIHPLPVEEDGEAPLENEAAVSFRLRRTDENVKLLKDTLSTAVARDQEEHRQIHFSLEKLDKRHDRLDEKIDKTNDKIDELQKTVVPQLTRTATQLESLVRHQEATTRTQLRIATVEEEVRIKEKAEVRSNWRKLGFKILTWSLAPAIAAASAAIISHYSKC